MKYRIYSPKNPGHRKQLASGNKIGLDAMTVMGDLDLAATPAQYELQASGQMMEEPGAMAALTDPRIRNKAHAGDILVLNGIGNSGAWLINRLTKSQAQLEEAPQFYRAVMSNALPRREEAPRKPARPNPRFQKADRELENKFQKLHESRIQQPSHGLQTADQATDAMISRVEQFAEENCERRDAGLTYDEKAAMALVEEHKSEICKHRTEPPKKAPRKVVDRSYEVIKNGGLVEQFWKLKESGKAYDLYMVNGWKYTKVKILEVGLGWIKISKDNEPERLLNLTAVSTVVLREGKKPELEEDNG